MIPEVYISQDFLNKILSSVSNKNNIKSIHFNVDHITVTDIKDTNYFLLYDEINL